MVMGVEKGTCMEVGLEKELKYDNRLRVGR
jgi:hypothetical protein